MSFNQPVLFRDYSDCSGCSACLAACSVNAISMEYNQEGFLYPNIDYKKCVGCLRCEKVCAFKRDKKTLISEDINSHFYACKNRDSNVLINSSSGGAFTALSDYFLENNWTVSCCLYSYEKSVVQFRFITDKELRDEARGSKYIQAEITTFYREIIDYLNNDPSKRMLIIGTGCQISGLDLILKEKKLRERALLVDLVCHGVASPKLWRDYISCIEKDNGGKINYLTFKNKKYGWEYPSVFAEINKKKISIKPYADWFYAGLSLRESCYTCPYTRTERNSDITIGDFWGIRNSIPEFYDKWGVSLLITHSEQGEEIFECIKGKIEYRETTKENCLQPRLVSPQICPANRKEFWRDMDRGGIRYCEKKYIKKDGISIKKMIKKILFLLRIPRI